eukprot:420061-Prorocentrum_lima.AAC.1
MASYRDLQKGCKLLELRASGTKSALYWRLVVSLFKVESSAARSEMLSRLAAAKVELDLEAILTALPDIDAAEEEVLTKEVEASVAAPISGVFVKVSLKEMKHGNEQAILA